MRERGPEFATEQFMLQGHDDTHTWVNIEPIEPLPGRNPDPAASFGTCRNCPATLTVGDVTADHELCPACYSQAHLNSVLAADEEGIRLMRWNGYYGPI